MAFRPYVPATSITGMALQGIMNYAGDALSAYANQSTTHVSSSGRVYGGSGGTFDGGVTREYTLPSWLNPYIHSVSELNQSSPLNQDTSGSRVYSSPVKPAVIDYLNADLAKHYGLGKETAYQEALSNTAYQRAVKDMQAAGLNPAAIFGSGKGYTAGGVSYVSDASGSSGRSGGSGSSQNGYLFDEGIYHAISTAAGLAGLAISKQPIGFYIAQTAAQGVMGAMSQFSK